ncbi:ATP-dependent Clp protease ATP-binding subunit ClpX [Striga asiatica]|uniref:ATP-dependent Clp protease ATP-binding subunit ClpX n=1 Tax=Striga asiatica TaxID=4170 RepID=A0A5A7Q182_STRAF|nr:ATP-dependent Clp protease ATP-binding subunit ClpX [Striga asiatica]
MDICACVVDDLPVLAVCFCQTVMQVAVGSLPSGVRARSRLLCVSLYPASKFAPSSSLSYCRSSNASAEVLLRPVSAVGSGMEASITDPKGKLIMVKDIEVVVESKDDDKMQVRVDMSGEDTQIVFEKILRSLARTAPPVPGFRREKGEDLGNSQNFFKICRRARWGQVGKNGTRFRVRMSSYEPTAHGRATGYGNQRVATLGDHKVPKDFLLKILGEDRVTNFVIQEIISSTVAEYVKKENLAVKDNKIITIQTAEELKSAFTPGSEFGFNATLELEKSSVESS